MFVQPNAAAELRHRSEQPCRTEPSRAQLPSRAELHFREQQSRTEPLGMEELPTERMASRSRPRRRAPGRAALRVMSGPEVGIAVDLREGTWVVGRALHADLRLGSPTVSRVHAKLLVGPGGRVEIVDLAATNPTRVNGLPVQRLGLRDGDRITVGEIDLELSAGDAVGSANSKNSNERVSLSERELEVARAVMDGLTNNAIGIRLGISRRTVGSHLSNIYERLQVGSRAELTRYLLENGVAVGR